MADPLITSTLLQMGGGAAGGLADMFTGQSEQDRANLAGTRAGTANIQQNTASNLNEMLFRNKSRRASGLNFADAKSKFLGKDVFDPQQGKEDVLRGLKPTLDRLSGAYNQKLGNVSSGIAERDLSENVLNTLGSFFAQGGRQNAIQSSNRDLSILMGNPYGRI